MADEICQRRHELQLLQFSFRKLEAKLYGLN